MIRNFTTLAQNVVNKCSISETKLSLHEKQLLNNLLLSINKGTINVLAQNPNIRKNFIDHVSLSSELSKLTRDWILKKMDLNRPDQYYQLARQMNRKIFIHYGPPNSGKTYNSINKLIEAKTGVYCAPLRLMAYEVFDKLTKLGIKANLLTGQKQIINNGSTHLVCTVEMLPLGKNFELGIIDEMQMISDESRGFAWTRAFFGLQVNELHLCGNNCALPIYTALANQCNESVKLIEYNRLTEPVKISETPITLDDLKPKDCLVSFSPINLFQYKSKLDCMGKKSCILYGSLPPETRLSQIEKFNSGDYILLATDVIGMGLNLNIQRVIFGTLEKHIDGVNRQLTPLELSQIVNRAGRFGLSTNAECGVLKEDLLNDFKQLLNTKPEDLCNIQISPEPNQLITFIESIKSDQHISPVVFVKTLKNLIAVTKPYSISQFDKMNRISISLEGINLTSKLIVEYLNSPLDIKHNINLAFLRLIASRHSDGLKIYLNNLLDVDKFKSCINTIADLKLYEIVYSMLDYYQYMSFKYPNIYIDNKLVEELKTYISNEITILLNSKIDSNFYQPIDETLPLLDSDNNFTDSLTAEFKGAINYISCKFQD